MIKCTSTKIYSTAAALIVTGLAFATPAHAAKYSIDRPAFPIYANREDARTYPPASDYQTPAQRQNTTAPANYSKGNQDWSVEDRISSLHHELRITQDQEPQWERVASVMRTNDSNIRQVASYRHRNANTMNAIQDLESYQTVAQAHVDGLQRLIPVFDDLYSDMSDAQRNQADQAFNRFQGRMPGKARK